MDDRKILVLTGASRGIGHATVKRFSKEGWRVITCSRHGFPENCPWEAGPEDHLQIDLGAPEDVERGVSELRTRLRGAPLHALVNNAGIAPNERKDILEADEKSFDRLMNVNLKGPYFLTQQVVNWMIQQKTKNPKNAFSIINISSVSGP